MAFTVWFTGLPGCGKTVISAGTALLLEQEGIPVRILQLDEIRRVLTPKPAYTDEERDIVYASLGYMARLLNECGVNVFIDATAHRRKYRDVARRLIPRFAEVYIRCPLAVCMKREAERNAVFSPKDIYKKSGKKEATVPGVNVPYEEPLHPEIMIDSDTMTPEQSTKTIADTIMELFGEQNGHTNAD